MLDRLLVLDKESCKGDKESKDRFSTAITITTLTSPAPSPSEISPATDDECDKEFTLLDEFLEQITIGGEKLRTNDFIDIDMDVSVFNEWTDINNPKILPPKITEAIQMIQKLRPFGTIEQPQLHRLIGELEPKLIDIYIDSKKKTPATMNEYLT